MCKEDRDRSKEEGEEECGANLAAHPAAGPP